MLDLIFKPGTGYGVTNMRQAKAKKPSGLKHTTKAAGPVLGAAGLTLSLAGSAQASVMPTQDLPRLPNLPLNHEIMLGEEEISDVSLATFYVFDKENTKAGGGVQLARGCGGCRGCGCGGCRCGWGCGGCCFSWGACRFC